MESVKPKLCVKKGVQMDSYLSRPANVLNQPMLVNSQAIAQQDTIAQMDFAPTNVNTLNVRQVTHVMPANAPELVLH